jgi:hypothetical protein
MAVIDSDFTRNASEFWEFRGGRRKRMLPEESRVSAGSRWHFCSPCAPARDLLHREALLTLWGNSRPGGTDPFAGNCLSLPSYFAKCQFRLVTNYPPSRITSLPRSTQPTRVSMLDLSAIHRPVFAFSWTVHGNFGSQYTLPSVRRSAALP